MKSNSNCSMSFWGLIAVVSLFFALFAGCADDPPAPKLNTPLELGEAKPVYYGQSSPTLYTNLTEAQKRSIVALYFKWYGQGFCSGNLITNQIVLTAAHCVDQRDAGGSLLNPNDVEVRIGADSSNPTARLDVSEVHYNSLYGNTERNDVAVLILSSPYYNAEPIPIQRGTISGLYGSNVQVVGFGKTQNSTDYSPNTIRYWTTMVVTWVTDNAITVDGNGQTGVAPGDSGSPLLFNINGEIRQIGVASTSAEGWVYYANYAPVKTNQNWIQSFIDQYDNPQCAGYCADAECGEVNGCACGDCQRGYECVGNFCQPIQPGEGGACVTLAPTRQECVVETDCGGDETCVKYQGNVSECGMVCAPDPCSTSDAGSYCLPLPLQGGGYLPLCIEDNPANCSTQYETCTTGDGRSGMCLQVFQGGPVACYGNCETVVTCPAGTACLPHRAPDCNQTCGEESCGVIGSCDCGQCDPGFECKYNRCQIPCQPECDGKECGPDGCGGLCGACAEDEICRYNKCECLPQCDGKQCGDDGCGGLCGNCGAGMGCNAEGRCEFVGGGCSGICGDSQIKEYCPNETSLCRCNSSMGVYQETDCAAQCPQGQGVCATDEQTGRLGCICESSLPDGDDDPVSPDGDIDQPTNPEGCSGGCVPMDAPFCIGGNRNLCQCRSLTWAVVDCESYCNEQGKEAIGCAPNDGGGENSCVCRARDGETDPPDDVSGGGGSDSPFDDDDGNNQDSVIHSDSGCSQTDSPIFSALFLLMVILVFRQSGAWRRNL